MNIFNLEDKIIYVIGGSGLVGQDVCSLLKKLGAKVFNLDVKRNFQLNVDIKFLNLDISKEKFLEKKLKSYFKIYGTPDCMVNCSYPASKSWHKSDFASVKKKL